MKKYIEDEIFRGVLIALLGVDILFVGAHLGIMNFGRWLGTTGLSLCIIAGLGLFALIIRSAGHYRGREEVSPNYFDRYPLEIYFIGDCCLVACAVALFAVTRSGGTWPLALLFRGIAYLGGIFGCMSVAVRCKTHTLITNTLVYKGLYSIGSFFGRIWDTALFYINSLPMYRHILAVMAAASAGCFWCMEAFGTPGGIICSLGIMAAVTLWLASMAIAYKKLAEGIEKIAAGDTAYQIDAKHMPAPMKKQAENLNSINEVVSRAVQKRVKSEQFRTELITNVSHDIKTPLTSIINYIDLIQKENVTAQPMADYVAVLRRQSVRLKKLIEDLVEASKASTGNISVNLSTTGLNLLLNQAMGEYTEKAENRGLELSAQLPEKEIYVLSDGRLLWRIFDNLLNNACKYSQPGTRVYISAEDREGKAVITFKNISKQQLNISARELMERFVRGDSSRNTEGSGLGLSIAQSLTEILNGTMALEIDGDMFKAILTFDTI